MKVGTIIVLSSVCAVTACGLYTHRRVIRALIKGEPMPKAPAWHVWVSEENRRVESSPEDEADLEEIVEDEA